MKAFTPAAFALLAIFTLLYGCDAIKKVETPPINIALSDDVVSLDPTITRDMVSETVARCLYSTLFVFDENMDIQPRLAVEAKQVKPDEWLVTLRRDATFHNASAISAEDVVFSLKRAMGAATGDTSLKVINDVKVVDQYSLSISTNGIFANLPSLLVRTSTSVMSKKAMEAPGYDLNKPVGSGPFCLDVREPGKFINLKRFEGFKPQPAKNERVNFIVEPSEQNRTAGLLNKKYQVSFRLSANDCDYLKLSKGIRVYEHPSSKMELLMFNPAIQPLDDIRVRQALSYAVNRKSLLENVASGYGQPLFSLLPMSVPGSLPFAGFDYNPDKAKELLREAGLENGFDLQVLAFDEIRKKMLEAIKLDLAQVGVRLNYEFLSLSDFLNAVRAGNHMCSLQSWSSNPDPDSTFTQLFSGNGSPTVNRSRFSHPRVEELILAGRMESNPENRKKIYEEAILIVEQSYTTVPLFQPSVLVATADNVGGVQVNAQGLFGYENLHWVNSEK